MLLVTGASGFVGQHLLSALEGQTPSVSTEGFKFLGVANRRSIPGGEQVDLRNPVAVADLFRKHRFDGVIHLAAESRTGECQKQPAIAYESNTNATRNLLQAAAPQQPWFLFVSTDMVFSGSEGNYREQHSPAPILEYGRSKALAEESVRAYPGKWCIVRPALIYGPPIGANQSMLSWTLDVLRSGTGRFFQDEIRTPVYVSDLVKLLIALYVKRHQGIVHAGGPDKVSRYEFAEAVAQQWEIPRAQVQSSWLSETPDASWRPRDVSLLSEEAKKLIQFTPLNEALRQIRESGAL